MTAQNFDHVGPSVEYITPTGEQTSFEEGYHDARVFSPEMGENRDPLYASREKASADTAAEIEAAATGRNVVAALKQLAHNMALYQSASRSCRLQAAELMNLLGRLDHVRGRLSDAGLALVAKHHPVLVVLSLVAVLLLAPADVVLTAPALDLAGVSDTRLIESQAWTDERILAAAGLVLAIMLVGDVIGRHLVWPAMAAVGGRLRVVTDTARTAVPPRKPLAQQARVELAWTAAACLGRGLLHLRDGIGWLWRRTRALVTKESVLLLSLLSASGYALYAVATLRAVAQGLQETIGVGLFLALQAIIAACAIALGWSTSRHPWLVELDQLAAEVSTSRTVLDATLAAMDAAREDHRTHRARVAQVIHEGAHAVQAQHPHAEAASYTYLRGVLRGITDNAEPTTESVLTSRLPGFAPVDGHKKVTEHFDLNVINTIPIDLPEQPELDRGIEALIHRLAGTTGAVTSTPSPVHTVGGIEPLTSDGASAPTPVLHLPELHTA